jgi:purine-nucleoside phosphorylase
LADEVESPAIIPTNESPNWPLSTVQGHKGRLVIGRLMGKPILVLQGRAHYYEGYSMPRIGLPVRVMQRLGVNTVILTNAAGGINPDFSAGDLMLITDHLSLLPMTGPNPLRGPNLDEFGPRFPDMSQVYDKELLAIAQKVSDDLNVNVRRGIYLGLSGPSFESPADVVFRPGRRRCIGMSTVRKPLSPRTADCACWGFGNIQQD